MVETTNSVNQLYNNLKAVLEIKTNKDSFSVWTQAFELNNSENKQVINSIEKLFVLCHRAKQDLVKLDKQYSEIGIKAISKIQYAFLKNGFGRGWHSIQKDIDEDTLNILILCNEMLKMKGYSQKSISKKTGRIVD